MGLDTTMGGEVHLRSAARERPHHSTGPAGLDVPEEAGGCNSRQCWHRGTAGEDPAFAVPLAVVPRALGKSQPALPPSGGLARPVGMACSCPCL